MGAMFKRCDKEDCSEVVKVESFSRCAKCEGHYCQAHLKAGTWYDGDVHNICFDCRLDDAEPTQY